MLLALLLLFIALITVANPEQYGVGGRNCTATEAPYMVAILYAAPVNRTFYYEICGGSLVAATWVLTAAHCFVYIDQEISKETRLDEKEVVCRMGAMYLYEGTGRSGSHIQNRNASKIIPHPDFNPIWHFDDIALVRTQSAFKLGQFVQVVNLPFRKFPKEAAGFCKRAVVMGWGVQNQIVKFDAGKEPRRDYLLKCADLDVITKRRCKRLSQYIVDGGRFCAINKKGMNISYGDSGGPVMCKGVQIGIVSASIGLSNKPGLFTKVATYKDFIRRNFGSSARAKGSQSCVTVLTFVIVWVVPFVVNKFVRM